MQYVLPPEDLVARSAHLVDAFCELAGEAGLGQGAAVALFGGLPTAIKGAPAFLDRLTGVWRYSYGPPFEGIFEDQIVVGTTQFPEVRHLFLVTEAAEKYLSKRKLSAYLKRLEEPAKHHDVLFELSPILRIGEQAAVEFEVAGYGSGNRTIDWRMVLPDGRSVLLEVKHRIKDIIDHLTEISPGLARGDKTPGGGPADPDFLFKDTVEKFEPADPGQRFQGVWIHTNVKIRESDLWHKYRELDPSRLHFAVLADWERGAYPLARDNEIRDTVMWLFGLEFSDRFVVRDSDGAGSRVP